ncbi:MAG: hypothetical protein NVS4B12_23370 [Ktedonobacteraceae bacterium]
MNTIPPTTLGIIGCGQISSIYLQAPAKFPFLQILACADINMQRAQTQAQRFHIPKACTVDALLADPAISIVVNLTVPNVHSDITLAALAAGKHVYSEKPLALSREQGLALLTASEHANKRIGCAPDTFLGAGIQTCIKLINDGTIGTPLAATAFMMNHGPEHWHPDPHFFYQPGAGPLFDMGPYYLTALISLFGPVRRVTASTRISFPQRTITSSPLYGSTISVQTPTHLAGILDFANDAVVTMVTSFDVWSHHLPRLEIYGSHGSLLIPDPNTFGGPVLITHRTLIGLKCLSLSLSPTIVAALASLIWLLLSTLTNLTAPMLPSLTTFSILCTPSSIPLLKESIST